MTRCGFNFLWMFSHSPGSVPPPPDFRALDFLAKHGFNFVRVPTDYRFWTTNFDYANPNEDVFHHLDDYLAACQERSIHMSLNLHRAPGYCINGNHLERHNLWLDEVAQDAFVATWQKFAARFLGVSEQDLSFDLLNEPPNIGQYGLTRDNHEALIRRTVAAIREIDSVRPIVIDGLEGGHTAMPELADLGVIHSGRGYQPMPVSHHSAKWWSGWETAPAPMYPGQVWEGRTWDREALVDFYQPWREVESMGAAIHIGEFGCYRETPNDIALRWLKDLFSVYKEFGWGWAMWNFEGDFGPIGHGRPGARLETMDGYEVDRDLWEIMMESRS